MSGGGVTFTTAQAKKNGLKIIVVDPRYSDSASVLADEWIALRPGTDTALIAGMIHVMMPFACFSARFCNPGACAAR